MIKKKTLKKLGFKAGNHKDYFYLPIIELDMIVVDIGFNPNWEHGLLGMTVDGIELYNKPLHLETKKDLKQLLKLLNV